LRVEFFKEIFEKFSFGNFLFRVFWEKLEKLGTNPDDSDPCSKLFVEIE